MKRVCGLAVLTMMVLATSLRAQVRVDNAEIWMTGEDRVKTFLVSNDGTDPLQVSLVNADWDRSEDGTNHFYEPGSKPSSCEHALTVFPRQLRLPPGASQSVRVTLNGDSLTARACWSIIFAQSEPPAVQNRGVGVRYLTRIGVKVYYVPAQTVTLAEVTEFVQATKATPADSDAVDLSVRNTGTRPIMLHGTLEIRRPDNFVVQRVLIDGIPLLPAALRKIHMTFPKTATGQYVALAVLDYGGPEDLAAQTPVELR